jgi:hypothetical protein
MQSSSPSRIHDRLERQNECEQQENLPHFLTMVQLVVLEEGNERLFVEGIAVIIGKT